MADGVHPYAGPASKYPYGVVVFPLQPSSSVNSGCPGPESSILVSSQWACPIRSQVTDHWGDLCNRTGEVHPVDPFHSLDNLKNHFASIAFCRNSSVYNVRNRAVIEFSLGTLYRSISLLHPTAKVMESLILHTINKYLQTASDQHGFRPDHSTTSALLQLATDIAIGFNQRKPTDLMICVTVYLSDAFDTVCYNNQLSKDQQITATSGHSAMTILLSKRKTDSEYILNGTINAN